jgi:hypothetical protein
VTETNACRESLWISMGATAASAVCQHIEADRSTDTCRRQICWFNAGLRADKVIRHLRIALVVYVSTHAYKALHQSLHDGKYVANADGNKVRKTKRISGLSAEPKHVHTLFAGHGVIRMDSVTASSPTCSSTTLSLPCSTRNESPLLKSTSPCVLLASLAFPRCGRPMYENGCGGLCK